MIERLRPPHSEERLKEIYQKPHSSEHWLDHNIRVESTISAGKFLLQHYDPWQPKIADLSCGDARIVNAVRMTHINTMDPHSEDVYLGDLAPGYPITGPIEETIDQIPDVDLFVLSETLEHLNNPMAVLSQIRAKTRLLLLSTPISEPGDSSNEEHLWSWDTAGVGGMLDATGFDTNPKKGVMMSLYLPTYYDFQIWGVK